MAKTDSEKTEKTKAEKAKTARESSNAKTELVDKAQIEGAESAESCSQCDNADLPADSAAEDELASERDRYLRLAAEYDNYRKRSAKERDLIYSNARADTVALFLPVYDNIERALKMECSDEAYYKGIKMMMTQLLEIFEDMGVKEIPAAGEAFDPRHHSAVMTVENPELGEKIITEELQKGFMLGDRVIRFSTVVVAN